MEVPTTYGLDAILVHRTVRALERVRRIFAYVFGGVGLAGILLALGILVAYFLSGWVVPSNIWIETIGLIGIAGGFVFVATQLRTWRVPNRLILTEKSIQLQYPSGLSRERAWATAGVVAVMGETYNRRHPEFGPVWILSWEGLQRPAFLTQRRSSQFKLRRGPRGSSSVPTRARTRGPPGFGFWTSPPFRNFREVSTCGRFMPRVPFAMSVGGVQTALTPPAEI